ncbi:hypothetical protein COE20_08940 [Bacillus cereus]|uniref:hypothetical protein n=1 Tax=Bacillus cereus group TaxID=86661 RepID=UPI00027C192E|nr:MULTISPECIES: hypothetical protein [Bacillus cereus group]EJV56039.1 hypothetical protein IEO_05540 [Bacillus wiedmannii]PDZ06311.1 hypothetical protein CON03_08635 [Bacillus cereus]PFE42481.1 hypothetical protein CN317_23975 [Bacillus cereus]PFN11503.1 hypothetical protein COJ72_31755 [Bacillus cereus]PGY29221.1 hypothetical protein COE20_08940 [Bacillus cereus]
MNNKQTKKIISAVLAGTFMFGVAAPLTFNVQEVKASGFETVDERLSQEEILDLLKLEKELKENNISIEDIMTGIEQELAKEVPGEALPLSIKNVDGPQYGPKSQAAKIAAKQMLKNLNRIGRVAWDRSVRQYVDKLPISWDSKKALKGYLSYTVVVKTLNVVIGFSGTITTAISNQLKKMGCPAWLADMTARAIVTLLL